MNLELIQLTIQGLAAKVANLEKRNQKLIKRIKKIEKRSVLSPLTNDAEQLEEDILIDTKEVLGMLGICYNTLQTIVNRNLLTPIRISARRLRYSKQAVVQYINSRSD